MVKQRLINSDFCRYVLQKVLKLLETLRRCQVEQISIKVSFKAHYENVNVISWNRLASCTLASRSDDRICHVDDLRLIKLEMHILHTIGIRSYHVN
ncbi:unnamed protein product [Microthlaspi erraticum]|uniref:Uncharacterized protein n=1 Tax=Microthlaspi erraticum TaxID=1685480 RepID=A0A6D2JXV5_9BRAS|nr:unnamed protein product [Microthlaspi erraticum]